MAVNKRLGAIRMGSKAGNKFAAGYIVENDTHYNVRGFFLIFNHEEGDHIDTITGVRLTFEPFSPVGGMVGELNLPKVSTQGEVDMPEHIMWSVRNTIDAETDNAKIRAKMLNRPIPGGTLMQPEDAIARVAQHMEKNEGKLPTGKFSHTDSATSITFGVFDVTQKSPYREEAEQHEQRD